MDLVYVVSKEEQWPKIEPPWPFLVFLSLHFSFILPNHIEDIILPNTLPQITFSTCYIRHVVCLSNCRKCLIQSSLLKCVTIYRIVIDTIWVDIYYKIYNSTQILCELLSKHHYPNILRCPNMLQMVTNWVKSHTMGG